MGKFKTVMAHVLCLFSMALYAGNYVSMVIFNEHFSGFYFNIVRTIMTLPVIPLLVTCNAYLSRPQASDLRDEEAKREIPLYRNLANCSGQTKIDPSSRTETLTDRFASTALTDAPGHLSSESCSTTPDTISSTMASTNKLIHESAGSEIKDEGVSARTSDYSNKINLSHHVELEQTIVKNSACQCWKKNRKINQFFAYSLSILSSYKLHPNAQWPVFISTVSGCVRQMVVPIALMFTTANAAGIIQPAVPVFSAFIAIAYGLEKFCWVTGVSVLFCMVGLFISEEGWLGFQDVSVGFFLLLLVPISKGFQIIGTQFASPYHSAHVIQTYQIAGLIVLTFPVAVVFELAFIRHWNPLGIITDFSKIDSASWFAILFTVIGILVIAWRIQIFCIKEFGSVGVSLYQSFQPLFTFVFSTWFLDEPVDVFQIVGAVIVSLGLAVYLLRKYLDHQEELRKKKADHEQQQLDVPGSPSTNPEDLASLPIVVSHDTRSTVASRAAANDRFYVTYVQQQAANNRIDTRSPACYPEELLSTSSSTEVSHRSDENLLANYFNQDGDKTHARHTDTRCLFWEEETRNSFSVT